MARAEIWCRKNGLEEIFRSKTRLLLVEENRIEIKTLKYWSPGSMGSKSQNIFKSEIL